MTEVIQEDDCFNTVELENITGKTRDQYSRNLRLFINFLIHNGATEGKINYILSLFLQLYCKY